MRHSSQAHPCPICGRSSTDHCRVDLQQNRIYCYRGVSHGPPDLRIGETIDVDGETYAYVKDQAGFGGNSAMFVLHDPAGGLGAPPATRADQLRRAAVAMQQVDAFERDAELADQAHRMIINLPLYEQMPPDRIRQALAICRDGMALLKSLTARSHRLRRHSPDIAPVAQRMQAALKEIGHQQRDLHRFWHTELLDPGAGRGQRRAQWLIAKQQENN